jgi:hypothetical protein
LKLNFDDHELAIDNHNFAAVYFAFSSSFNYFVFDYIHPYGCLYHIYTTVIYNDDDDGGMFVKIGEHCKKSLQISQVRQRQVQVSLT